MGIAALFTSSAGCLVLAACGSSGSSNTPAFVSTSAAVQGPYVSKPSRLEFSADGSLVAEHLQWSDWGQPIALGKGLFLFRDFPSQAEEAIRGSITLSEPKRCYGKIYYTGGVINAPGGPFKPISPITYGSGC